MIRRININKEGKVLLTNFFSLSMLQAVNMVLPLLTFPYLVRVLGPENFGLINFVLSIVMYFGIFVDFGFNLSATREVSIHRENKIEVSKIFSTVIMIKFMLLVISLLVLTLMIFLIDDFGEYAILYFVTFGMIFGNCLFPSWFFQGMERMKFITYISVFSKVIVTLLIFIVIKESKDYIYVPVLNTIGALFSGITGFLLAFKMFGLHWKLFDRQGIIHMFRESFHFFLSRFANDGSKQYATTIIGLLFGNVMVGYYTIVAKLFYAFMSVSGIVAQTIYPYMSRTRNLLFFKRIIIYTSIVSFLTLLPILYFNTEILHLVFDVKSESLSKIFVIVFSGAIFGVISTLLGYPLLAAFGYIKYANNSLIYASIIYIIYISLSAYWLKDIYLVASSLIVYALIGLLFRIYFIKKTKIFKNKLNEKEDYYLRNI